MQIGQNIKLLTSSTYGEYYDAPAISSRAYGVTAGIIGKITKLNVAGVSDTNTFTEFEKNSEKFYVRNSDFGTDFETVDAPTNGNTGGETGGSGTGSGGLIDTLGKFFDFAKTIFGKKDTTTPTTGKPDGGTDGKKTPDPTPDNNENKTGVLAWLSKNWYWVLLAIVVPGGLIWWGVSAAKKKAQSMMGDRSQQNPKNNGNPNL